MRALDLFCGAGGATNGLQRAGFHVTGIDIRPQPRYCGDAFIQADIIGITTFRGFDFVWASPPCQAYTRAQRINDNKHPDLISLVRDRLRLARVSYCIENVIGAPLLRPIELCGAMFGLKTYRHRIFETSFAIEQPMHEPHAVPQQKMGRRVVEGNFIQVVGNFSGVSIAREAMGIPWMSRDELKEAIPPAYAEFIGRAAGAAEVLKP